MGNSNQTLAPKPQIGNSNQTLAPKPQIGNSNQTLAPELERREYNRILQRRRRKSMSDEQKSLEKERRRIRYKQLRENMSEEQKSLQRERNRIHWRKRKENVGDHKKSVETVCRKDNLVKKWRETDRQRQGRARARQLDGTNVDDVNEIGSSLREQVVEQGLVLPDTSGGRDSVQSVQESEREHPHERQRRSIAENVHLIQGEEMSCVMHQAEVGSSMEMHNAVLDMNTGGGSSAMGRGGERLPTMSLGRYDAQKRRDWNTFSQYLKNHSSPISLSQCSNVHVVEFLKHLDQFGKSKVHIPECPFFGHPNSTDPCACLLEQAWGSKDALVGRLRAAFEENGGQPHSNPFGKCAVRVYLREVRDSQAKARGLPYGKKKRKRIAMPAMELGNAATSAVVIESGGGLSSEVTCNTQHNTSDEQQMDGQTFIKCATRTWKNNSRKCRAS